LTPGKPARKRPGPPESAARPVLLVLAGVNGAGKSSVGGEGMLRSAGLAWFNPDAYARRLVEQLGLAQEPANAQAWQHGLELLDRAVAAGRSHAFETTLGGDTLAQRIVAASSTHDVLMWYCGLASPEQHIARVAQRVAAGGHAIPEAKIRERWLRSPIHLIELMPWLDELRVYDNSAEAAAGAAIDDPRLVLHLVRGEVQFPRSLAELQRTPAWAKPIVKAARDLAPAR
jgi:predicted ABC-type ATPase